MSTSRYIACVIYSSVSLPFTIRLSTLNRAVKFHEKRRCQHGDPCLTPPAADPATKPEHRRAPRHLTSHGSPDGLAVTGGRRSSILTSTRLGGLLDQTGVRHKVVIISAC